MDNLTDRRGMFRIGVMITAATVMVLALAATAPVDGSAVLPWLALGLLGATGIGLLVRARFARVLAGLLLLACAVAAPLSWIQLLAASAPLMSADPAWFLSVANATATTLLLVWICLRGIRVLLGRPRRASAVTVRLVGGTLAVVAAHHLWLVHQLGATWTGSWSIHIAPQGTQLVGFPGWPLWHVALLIVALVLVAGPRRVLGRAATGLMLLFVSLVPLVIVAAIRTELVALALPIFGITLFPVYLSWWLRDELPPDRPDVLVVR
jgi:hypothetical protein